MTKYFLLLILFFFSSKTIYAKVVINEFLIDSSPQQVELYNTATESSSISNWYIDDNGGNTYFTVPENTTIYPQACLTFSGDFNLNKSSADTIRLFDSNFPPTTSSAILIDSFSYKAASGSASFFRYPDGENIWATGAASLGFYNKTNQNCIVSLTPAPSIFVSETLPQTPSNTPFPSIFTSPTQQVPSNQIEFTNIFLSEVMAYPETGEKEWFELYNDNDFIVNLENWYIDDGENMGSAPKLFSLTIQPKSYGVFDLSSSLFNNSYDSVRLLDVSKKEVDSFEYTQASKNISFSRESFDSDIFCKTVPTKNYLNTLCNNPLPPTEVATNTQIAPLTKKIVTKINRPSLTQKPQVKNINLVNSKRSVSIQTPLYSEEILGEQTRYSSQKPFKNSEVLVKAFSTSSLGIAVLNICFILLTIIKKMQINNSFQDRVK
jgi:hypothetical protein